MCTVQPRARGCTRCTISTSSPTRQVHERPASLATIRAGTGTTPSSRAAPDAPRETSGSPRPHAPRTCGAQAGHACGRESSAHAARGEPVESSDHVRIDRVYPRALRATVPWRMADVTQEETARQLPDPGTAREWLE